MVKSRMQDQAEPFRSANLWIPDGTPVTFDDIAYWVTIPWDNHGGRITLAGDAAHPQAPRKHPSFPRENPFLGEEPIHQREPVT